MHLWCSGNTPSSHGGDAGSTPAGCSVGVGVGDVPVVSIGSMLLCQGGGAGSTPARCSDSPLCCNGSLPSWYGGSVGSTPTGGSDNEFRV